MNQLIGDRVFVRLAPAQAVALGVILSWAGRRPPTHRELQKSLGCASPAYVRTLLIWLRAQGLIAFEDGLNATLRQTCRFVPASEIGGGQ